MVKPNDYDTFHECFIYSITPLKKAICKYGLGGTREVDKVIILLLFLIFHQYILSRLLGLTISQKLDTCLICKLDDVNPFSAKLLLESLQVPIKSRTTVTSMKNSSLPLEV